MTLSFHVVLPTGGSDSGARGTGVGRGVGGRLLPGHNGGLLQLPTQRPEALVPSRYF